MTRIWKTMLVVVLANLLSACASGPKFAEVEPGLAPLAAGSGRIYIYRVATLGAAVQPEVKLNGVVIGTAIPQGFFYADRPPGNYEVLTSTEVDRELSFTLDSGQTRYVRLDISMGFFVGHVYPELVDPIIGETEIQGTSYTGGP